MKYFSYSVKPPTLFEKKLACIIRAKSESIPSRKSLKCEIISPTEELPHLDKKEDYASYVFRIRPRNTETQVIIILFVHPKI